MTIVGEGPVARFLIRRARSRGFFVEHCGLVEKCKDSGRPLGADLVLDTSLDPSSLRDLEAQMSSGAILAALLPGWKAPVEIESLSRPHQFVGLRAEGEAGVQVVPTAWSAPGVVLSSHWFVATLAARYAKTG